MRSKRGNKFRKSSLVQPLATFWFRLSGKDVPRRAFFRLIHFDSSLCPRPKRFICGLVKRIEEEKSQWEKRKRLSIGYPTGAIAIGPVRIEPRLIKSFAFRPSGALVHHLGCTLTALASGHAYQGKEEGKLTCSFSHLASFQADISKKS